MRNAIEIFNNIDAGSFVADKCSGINCTKGSKLANTSQYRVYFCDVWISLVVETELKKKRELLLTVKAFFVFVSNDRIVPFSALEIVYLYI